MAALPASPAPSPPSARPIPNTIVVHAGDTLSPSLMSSFDKGRAIMALLNAIKPEVFVPGNHEFDFGEAVFLERMGEAQFARLAANLRTAAGAKVAGFDDTLVIDRGGVKIGFIGLTDQDSAVRSSPGTLTFLPLGKTGEAQAKALRRSRRRPRCRGHPLALAGRSAAGGVRHLRCRTVRPRPQPAGLL